jgi:peroxiredoxin
MPSWFKIEVEGAGENQPANGPREKPPAREPNQPRTINVGWLLTAVVVLAVIVGLWLTHSQWQALLPGQKLAPDVLATVNGEPVTVKDVDLEFAMQSAIQAELGRGLKQDAATIAAFRRDLLDQVVDQKLLLAAAATAGISVTDQELASELPKLGEGYNIKTDSLKSRAIATGTITAQQFQEWARRSLIVGRYMATAEAKEKGLQTYRDRGYSDQQLPAVKLQPGDVASFLQRTADVRFNFGTGQAAEAAQEGKPAPDVALSDLNGNTHRLSDYKGKPVMINFWATWCTPCKIELPIYVAAYDRNKDKGLVILAVDEQEQVDLVQKFVTEQKLPLQVLLDKDGQAATLYRVRGLPSTYFVNADGVLVKAQRGALKSDDDLMPLLKQIQADAR